MFNFFRRNSKRDILTVDGQQETENISNSNNAINNDNSSNSSISNSNNDDDEEENHVISGSAMPPQQRTATVSSSSNKKRGRNQRRNQTKNLVTQEKHYENQLAELTERLRARDAETNDLRSQIVRFQCDLNEKSNDINRLQSELNAAHETQDTLTQLQRQLVEYEQRNSELTKEIDSKNNKTIQLEQSLNDVNERLKLLETELTESKEKNNQLDLERIKLQESLEKTLTEKDCIEKKKQEAFEQFRTVNTNREQQMLEDFEWKLREVHQTCKKRLDEKDRSIEQKLKNAEQQLNEVTHLRSYEAEVTQLRGLTHDQQHSLRTMLARLEQMQSLEQNLNEEIDRLRNVLEMEQCRYETLVRQHEKNVADKERMYQIGLEKQRGDVAVQWEQKLRHECVRLKAELEQLHNDEKYLAIELVKLQMEQEFQKNKQLYLQQIEQDKNQLIELKESLVTKEKKYQMEMERLRTNSDRDIVELRRELDRTEMLYHERIEKILEEHEHELDRVNNEGEKRIKDMEQNNQMQVSSMRATLELVKEQMEREQENIVQQLNDQHHRLIDEQWTRLTNEKNTELECIRNEYKCKLETIQDENKIVRNDAEDLKTNVDTLYGGMQVLTDLIVQNECTKTETEQKMRELQVALKTERDKLKTERNKQKEHLARIQKQSQFAIQELRNKYQYLTKLFKEKSLTQCNTTSS